MALNILVEEWPLVTHHDSHASILIVLSRRSGPVFLLPKFPRPNDVHPLDDGDVLWLTTKPLRHETSYRSHYY